VHSKSSSEFIAEATEIVDILGRDVLALGQSANSDTQPYLVNGIFRAAHSLKGLASMFGQDRIAQLAHKCEDLLDNLRLGRLELSTPVLDALVEAVEVFQALLEEASRDDSLPRSSDRAKQISEKLQQLNVVTISVEPDSIDQLELDGQTRTALTEYEEHRLRENLRKGLALWRVKAAFNILDFDQGLARLTTALKRLGEVICTLPAADSTDGGAIAFDLIAGSRATEAQMRSTLQGLNATWSAMVRKGFFPAPMSEVAPVPELPDGAGKGESPPSRTALGDSQPVAVRPRAKSSLRSLTKTVRVDIRRLDALMNAVGELLLVKNNIQKMADSARHGGNLRSFPLWGQELYRESRLLGRKLDELQKGILEARMVPLSQIFDKLDRLVRRIAGDAGKEIEFSISGGEVELDKLIVEELSDPLMHIVRNAIDHGIETPADRERQGKPTKGLVSVRAMQRGNHVVIEVSDDGVGLDDLLIREVAIQKGVITPAQVKEMSSPEVQGLVFLPGFSTAPRVSELSGRGVGLDVAKTNIAHMSGTINISSHPGKGSTFIITLPETLAIVRALVVKASGRTYAIPLGSVQEVIASEAAEVRSVGRHPLVSLRGAAIPLLRLSQLFGLPIAVSKKSYVMVVAVAQQRFGVMVDELIGQQDIVIKSLGDTFQYQPGISGATDLGNRTTVLVVDIVALIEAVISSERRSQFI